MENIGRRSALALGLVAAATPALVFSRSASQHTVLTKARSWSPASGRLISASEEAIIPGYKTVSMRDIVCEPGSHIPNSAMENDMVCHMTEGELRVVQDGKEFTAKKGDVWTCAKGTEEAWNEGDVVAIMRVTDLLAA